MSFLNDLKVALRSLDRSKGWSLPWCSRCAGHRREWRRFLRWCGVLLRPLVNRDENRLIYIRQSAAGMGTDNTTFSVPEVQTCAAA